jgi:replicative DNA helicase
VPDREPAHDLRAEQGVIGALLHNPAVFSELGKLRPEHFYVPNHELIFSTIQVMYAEGVPVDAMTVFAELQKTGRMRKTVIAPYLHTCMKECTTPANAGYYAQIVIERWQIRTINGLGLRFQHLHDDPGDIPEALEAARTFLDEIDSQQDAYSIGFRDLYEEWADDLEENIPAIETPWPKVNDQLAGGLRRGRLIVLGARPGCGKTIMGTQMGLYGAQLHHRSLIFSVELARKDLAGRVMACGAQVPYREIVERSLSPESHAKVSRWAAASAEMSFDVDGTPDITIEEIAQRCRIHKQRFGLDYVFIDYAQYLEMSKGDNREQQVAHIAIMARKIAQKLDCVVVLAAQLNRKIEDTNGKPRLPVKSDFRESGGLEQTADVAIILSRVPDENGEESKAPLMNVSFVKNRMGTEGTIQLVERFDQARFAA